MHPSDRILEFIDALRHTDGRVRERARMALVALGSNAVEPLTGLLTDRDDHMRWIACKALASLADPRSAPALVDALRDESFEIQWLAAEGLIAMGSHAVRPLLTALEEHFPSVYLRQGAHHVLHALERTGHLDPETLAVLDSLRSLRPPLTVAMAARRALNAIHHVPHVHERKAAGM
jgi:hypothetical protein